MKKYLYIDTNIFIQCSFLEMEDGDTLQSLEKLLEVLQKGHYLLLPEVTKLEIIKRLETKKEEIHTEINNIKKESKRYNGIGKKIAADINNKITEVFEDRIKNYEEVGTKIEEIFNNGNTKNIPLKTEHIAEGYKFYITGKRPFSKKNVGKTNQSENQKHLASIQSDCLNIIAIQEFLNEEGGAYEFYFCSKDGDFFEDNSDEIHKDINEIVNIKNSNKNLGKLLQENFGISFSESEIEQFDSKNSEDEIVEAEGLLSEDIGLSTENGFNEISEKL